MSSRRYKLKWASAIGLAVLSILIVIAWVHSYFQSPHFGRSWHEALIYKDPATPQSDLQEWREGAWEFTATHGAFVWRSRRQITTAPNFVQTPAMPFSTGWILNVDPERLYIPPGTIQLLGFARFDESFGCFWPNAVSDTRIGKATVIPMWAPFTFAASLSAFLCASLWKKRLQNMEGHCPNCGYDLRATPTRCPECGSTIQGVARDSTTHPSSSSS